MYEFRNSARNRKKPQNSVFKRNFKAIKSINLKNHEIMIVPLLLMVIFHRYEILRIRHRFRYYL